MFSLHPTLAADTVEIACWQVCRVLLMKDANYPWLILVPARAGLCGLHELSTTDRPLVMDEIAHASNILKGVFNPVRINVAALGNMVAQLHIHVIARFKDDPAWPGPVWGAEPRREYLPEELADRIAMLQVKMRDVPQ